jgi:hypothetical protein
MTRASATQLREPLHRCNSKLLATPTIPVFQPVASLRGQGSRAVQSFLRRSRDADVRQIRPNEAAVTCEGWGIRKSDSKVIALDSVAASERQVACTKVAHFAHAVSSSLDSARGQGLRDGKTSWLAAFSGAQGALVVAAGVRHVRSVSLPLPEVFRQTQRAAPADGHRPVIQRRATFEKGPPVDGLIFRRARTRTAAKPFAKLRQSVRCTLVSPDGLFTRATLGCTLRVQRSPSGPPES